MPCIVLNIVQNIIANAPTLIYGFLNHKISCIVVVNKDATLRLSVGIENIKDLLEELERVFGELEEKEW